MKRQVTHTLQNAGGLLQRTFCGLRQRDTIIRVAGRDIKAIDLAGQTVGDLQTGSIVFCAVDAETGGQALEGSVQALRRSVQVALGVEGRNVCVDCKGHGIASR